MTTAAAATATPTADNVRGWSRKEMAKRLADDIPEGWYVNLGIGIPLAVGDFIPSDREVVLQSELANFRDYDLHLVAPYVFDSSSEISLEVTCRTPGPGLSDCPVGAAILGFVDDVG